MRSCFALQHGTALIQHNAICIARDLCCDVTQPHIIRDSAWIALKRIAKAAAA